MKAIQDQNVLLSHQNERLLEIVDSKRKDNFVRPTSNKARQRIRAVHQFHSGSFLGDAITNSMFLIQRLLRQLGFESEIFVEHRSPELADRLRLIDELPQHEQYVLLVHHSMGYNGFDRITRVPAAKLLIYHNITPAELFPDDRHTQHYIKLGHEQLSEWRPMIAAALAVSEFNAIELRRLGYDPVHTCPLLFDIEEMLKETVELSGPREPFTILFVGRIVPSKAQADLVDAFAVFRKAFGKPCRLVLVGRTDSDQSYTNRLIQHREQQGIGDSVLLTGSVSDQELHEWYRRADLYVSLSHHEGFGVPLVEAMVHQIPVLAWPAGAVPYTLNGAGELLMDRSPAVVAEAMLRFATDAMHRNTVVERQSRSLERFRLKRHIPQLLAALGLAGATPPETDDSRRALRTNMCFTITGHVAGTYSLATINRAMALALEFHAPGRVRFLPVETDPTTDLSRVPYRHRTAISKLAARAKGPTGPQVVVSHHYPPYIPPDRGDLALALVFWEEGLLPESMVKILNRGFQALLAPSEFVAKALIDSGVSIPVVRSGQPVELEQFFELGEKRQSLRQKPFTFLHVSSCFPRKGVDVLLAAYAQAFTRADPVKLVIKGFPNPHNDIADQLARLRSSRPDLPEIAFINEDIEQEALIDLYRQADAVLLPTRGEGFNLPAAEAIAAGIPLIVTAYGGHRDFCRPDNAHLIDFRFEPSRSHVASPHSCWVEPSINDLVAAMQEFFQTAWRGDDALLRRAARARSALRRRLDTPTWSDRLVDIAADLLVAPPAHQLRLGWISSWNVPCGIASYSDLLLSEMLKQDDTLSARTVVLADYRASEKLPSNGPRVRTCWHLGDDASELAAAIAIEDVDVLVVQHQPGLINWRSLTSLLRNSRLRNRHVIVTLHTVAALLQLSEDDRQAVVEALSSVSRILVHTVIDLNILKELGLLDNVTLFPHGAVPATARLLRKLPSITSPLIGSYGFFLPGKGISRLIGAAALLRHDWPSLRLRLVNAVYPGEISTATIAACRAQSRELGIEQAIEWVTDFLPHEESIALLSECDLVVLPYDESKESASGAVRVALASGAPVATTPIRLFDELGDAVARISTSSAEVLADGLKLLLNDAARRRGLQEAAAVWSEEHNWSGLARRFAGMLSGLHATAPRRRPLSVNSTMAEFNRLPQSGLERTPHENRSLEPLSCIKTTLT
jgi:glycosyltransferase involved in cell wall biosynthesis